MRRSLALLLFLAPLVVGQGDSWITEILNPRTSPTERQRLLALVAKTEQGREGLANRGLDGRRDPEVVHAVVDTLLNAGKYEGHLEKICRLVNIKVHREKVLTRLQRLGEEPALGKPLRDGILSIARGKSLGAADDPKLRSAAIRVLGRIPRREALEAVIEVGLGPDEQIKNDARQVIKEIFGTTEIKTAQHWLAARPGLTYYDILREQLKIARAELETLRDVVLLELGNANAVKALASLGGRDDKAREVASKRLRELADKAEFDPLSPKEFATRVYNAFVAERESETRNATTMASLINTMTVLARGGDKAPLWQAHTKAQVVGALQPLSDGDSRFADNKQAAGKIGSAAVRLLDSVSEEAATTLVAFAERFGQSDVRQEAIQILGTLARRADKKRDYIGRKLAGMLQGEKDPDVRKQVLSTLALPYVPVGNAFAAIRTFLVDPKSGANLEDSEIRDSITILGKIGSDEALDLLRKVAFEHAQVKVRGFAIEEGLLPWADRNGKAKKILAEMQALATAKTQSLEVRRIVIAALGRKGFRNSLATLKAIGATAGLEEPLRDAVLEAKMELAERLAVPDAGKVVPEDLQTAIAILEEELTHKDTARLERLARKIIETGDEAKVPVGTTRYLLVEIYKSGKDRKESDLLALFEDARSKAVADGLASGKEMALLADYKELLLKKDSDPERVNLAIDCLGRMAKLAAAESKERAAEFYLRAAGCAVKLKNKDLANGLLNLAMGTEGIVAGGENDATHKTLRAAVDALPDNNG